MSGGSRKTAKRSKDSEMAKRLPPSPMTWRQRAHLWPYHNNLGTSHADKSGKYDTRHAYSDE